LNSFDKFLIECLSIDGHEYKLMNSSLRVQ
jgi:hypothetical protein